MNTNIGEQVIKILDKVPLAKNLACRKSITLFVLGLVESRNIQFQKVNLYIDSQINVQSTEVGIQAFLRLYI